MKFIRIIGLMPCLLSGFQPYIDATSSYKKSDDIQQSESKKVELLKNILGAKSITASGIDAKINELKRQHPEYIAYFESQQTRRLIEETKAQINTNCETVLTLIYGEVKTVDQDLLIAIETHGIDLPLNNRGETCLMQVLYNLGNLVTPDFDRLFQALLDAHADPNAKSEKGLTPFDFLKRAMESIAWSSLISESEKDELLPRGWQCIETLKRYGAHITSKQEHDLKQIIENFREEIRFEDQYICFEDQD